ncbi:MAG: 1-acyl-sn-glycerol-3-phosphate acyltransferase, partial [Firmicutes bacterium]|nr:1-acyl-sn-glycerol-3-phosphate acyltransferase [Bacillota bacterium]
MFYGFVKLIIGFCFKIYFRIEIYGSHHIPPTGGMILASNHVSYLDPLFMGCGINRPISFMAKQELFDIPAIGWLIRKLYVFPVK